MPAKYKTHPPGSLNRAMRDAIVACDGKALVAALDRGANPDARFHDGDTALMLAARAQNLEAVTVLLTVHRHPRNFANRRNRREQTALMLAFGHAGICDALRAVGADARMRDALGFTMRDYYLTGAEVTVDPHYDNLAALESLAHGRTCIRPALPPCSEWVRGKPIV